MWGRVPTPPPLPTIEDDRLEESDSDDDEIRVYPPLHAGPTKPKIPPIQTTAPDASGRPTPPLPLSPISNASPPPRKRKRADTADRPDYVLPWLPPFPTNSPPPSPSPAKEAVPLSAQRNNPDKPLTPPPQLSTSATTSDYLTPVPYAMSSISSVPEWHLPRPPSPSSSTNDQLQQPMHPTPQVTPALLKAYHHILTNKPPANAPINPARHKVAMSMLHEAHSHPRWTSADTLFSATIPGPPRVVAPVPSYPVPLTDPSLNALEAAAKVEKEKERPPLPVLPRTVIASESLTPVSNQPFSRLPGIARQVLAVSIFQSTKRTLYNFFCQFQPSVLTRVTKMAPPQPLTRGAEKLLYGPGLPAPWNSGAVTPAPAASKVKDEKNGKQNGKEEEPKVETLPDSLLFATWEYEPKDFRVPVVSFAKKNRTTGPSWTPLISAGGGGHISDRRKGEKHERRG